MAFVLPAIAAIGPMLAGGVAAAGGAASAASIGATALGMAGTGIQAVAANRAANFNADVSMMQARQAEEQGALKASEIIRRNNQEQAAGRAGALQNGFALSGSVSDVLDQSRRQGYGDALAAVYDGRVSAAGSRTDAKLSRSSGRNAIAAGVIGMGAQALTGVSNHYGRQTRQIGV